MGGGEGEEERGGGRGEERERERGRGEDGGMMMEGLIQWWRVQASVTVTGCPHGCSGSGGCHEGMDEARSVTIG